MMLISNGICSYEGKYAALKKSICHFLGPSPSVISGKISKAQKHIPGGMNFDRVKCLKEARSRGSKWVWNGLCFTLSDR